ncbi:MAG: S8 family serine peptidase, partial [Actinomycetota bacterium]
CKGCLVVSVQFVDSVNLLSPGGSTQPNVDAVRWTGNNSTWIDAQSNSWGPIAPGWDPTGTAGILVTNPALAKVVEEVSQKHPAFWAVGNGAAFRGGVLGHPTIAAPHLGPSAIIVGGMDSGYVTTWTGFSAHVVSDACNDWGAYWNSTTGSADTVGSGTSSATPFAAGGAVDELLEARKIFDDHSTGVHNGVVASGPAGLVPSGPLADGVFTMAEWKQLLFHTATARPVAQPEDGPTCSGTVQFDASPVKWSDVPSQFPEYIDIGYGAVDDPARAFAKQVLHGTAALPARPQTDQYFAVDSQVRSVTYQVYSTGP